MNPTQSQLMIVELFDQVPKHRLGCWLNLFKRSHGDRLRLGRLYFGWFGGVQCFYRREDDL